MSTGFRVDSQVTELGVGFEGSVDFPGVDRRRTFGDQRRFTRHVTEIIFGDVKNDRFRPMCQSRSVAGASQSDVTGQHVKAEIDHQRTAVTCRFAVRLGISGMMDDVGQLLRIEIAFGTLN